MTTFAIPLGPLGVSLFPIMETLVTQWLNIPLFVEYRQINFRSPKRFVPGPKTDQSDLSAQEEWERMQGEAK